MDCEGAVVGEPQVWYECPMAISADEMEIIGPDAVERAHRMLAMGHRKAAFGSIRAMRRLLERVTAEAYSGRRPMKDLTAMSVAVKTMAELFVAEKMLMAQGLDLEEAAHPLGDMGGMPDLSPRQYVTRTKSVKKGTSAKGTPIDEVKISDTGGAEPATLPNMLEEADDDELDEFS